MRHRARAGLGVLLCAVALSALSGGGTAHAAGCRTFSFEHNGVPWKATSISVADVSCRKARKVIRRYAKPRRCQFQERCRVRRWSCRTLEARGSTVDERCTRGRRVVRWHGRYVSS